MRPHPLSKTAPYVRSFAEWLSLNRYVRRWRIILLGFLVEAGILQLTQTRPTTHNLAGALAIMAISVPMLYALSDIPFVGAALALTGALAYVGIVRSGPSLGYNYLWVAVTWLAATMVVAIAAQVKRVHAEQRHSNLVSIVNSASEAIITVTTDEGVVLSWNRAAERLYGYAADEIIGQPFAPALVPEEETEIFDGLLAHASSGESNTCTVQRVCKDGHRLWVEATATPVRVDNRVVAVLSIARDVTEERRLHAQVKDAMDDRERSEEIRRELVNMLLSAEEEERQRIAQELHDDTIQVMASTGLILDAVMRGLTEASKAEVGDALETAQEALRGCLARTRHLMFELHPAVLEHQGLEPAVREIVTQAADDMQATRVVCEVNVGRLDPIMESMVFRIVRECVVNARKHSGAECIAVKLYRDGSKIVGRIEDDGCGFEMATLVKQQQGVYKHLGLSSLVERVHLAGGQAHIRTSPGNGTSLAFWIPVRDELPDSGSLLLEASGE